MNQEKMFQHKKLTEREQEILELIAQGKKRKEIAQDLFISVHTYDTHRKNIKEKLKIKTGADLVKYAIRLFQVKKQSYLVL